MADYSSKFEREDGSIGFVASDGSEFDTRPAAYRHSKRLEEEEAPDVVADSEPPAEPDDAWTTFEWDSGSPPSDTVPALLKRVTPAGDPGRKKSKRELKAERQTNSAILGILYRSGDHLMTRYRRVMLEDPKAEAISHSDEDYVWISGVTNAALEDNGLSIGSAIGSTHIALIANGAWFGTPLYRIHRESEKSPFKGRVGGTVRRFLERMPVIGPRLRRRSTGQPILEAEEIANDETR